MIFQSASSISDLYLGVLSNYNTSSGKYESNSAAVHLVVKDDETFCFTKKCLIYNYINEFETQKIDQRWDTNMDWYLSYARRIYLLDDDNSSFNYLIKSLKEDKNTRRSIIFTKNDKIDGLYYMPALSSIYCEIANEKLNMVSSWRSKELIYSFPISILSMLSYMRLIYKELKNFYPNLEKGTYSEFINSLHINQKIIFTGYINSYDDVLQTIDNENNNYIKFMYGIVDKNKENIFDSNY